MSTITLDGVTKRFGDLTAVDDIDLDVADGEFLVLVGPSGCGKSTLLRTIAGLERPTEGDLFIDGERVNNVEPKNRNIAMVFQNYALYPHMSAKRNMTFGMNSQGSFTDEEIESRVQEAAEMLGIADLLDRKPAELSGGEQQRVAMGRALIRDPGVFLLDEPLSNLDAKLRDEMRAELTNLHDELQTTTVYVTHDQTEAMTLGDRVAVMNAGQIQQVDEPQRVYEYPNNRFVAEFIGSPRMNIFDVEIRREGDAFVAGNGSLKIELVEKPTLQELVGERLALGIRPEDVYLAVNRTEGVSDPFQAEVRLKEPLGDSLVIHATIDGMDVRMQTSPRQPVDDGDVVDLVIDPKRVHLFDPSDGTTVYHSDPSESAQTVSKSPA